MSSENIVFDALLHLGYAKLKDGLYDEAIETFSAAHILDSGDERAIHARGLAYDKLGQSS